MFSINFEKFDFIGFKDFIFDLLDTYGFYEIRFYPERRDLFSDVQLKHVAPNRSIHDKNGFIWAWMQKQNEVKKVSFDFWSKDERIKITMTVDTNKKIISLDKISGISSIEIEDILKKYIKADNGKWKSKIEALFIKYLLQIFIGVSIMLIGGYFLYKLKWS